MSMNVQNSSSGYYAGVRNFASATASKMSRAMNAVGNCIAETTRKAADFAKPHFQNLKTFAQENRQSIIISAVAFAVGVATAIIMSKVFCRGTNTVSSTGIPAAPAAPVAAG
ncbi:MAG: hypothetical protein WA347_01325 [Rhabdochlamydiaceae bacterium]|jgi:hypothetical protein